MLFFLIRKYCSRKVQYRLLLQLIKCRLETQTGLNGMLEYRSFTKPVPYREVIIAYRKSYPRMKAVELIKESIANCKLDIQ